MKFKRVLLLLWFLFYGTSVAIGLLVIPEVIITGKSTINLTLLIVATIIGAALGIKWLYDWKAIQKKLDRLKELESEQAVT